MVSLAGAMGHVRCADELGVVRGGLVRQRAANVLCCGKEVEALSRNCAVRRRASDGDCRHKQMRSASTPWRCSRMRLQLVERKRPLNAGVAADPAKLETGAQITSVKAHMLLWRRTLECCPCHTDLVRSGPNDRIVKSSKANKDACRSIGSVWCAEDVRGE